MREHVITSIVVEVQELINARRIARRWTPDEYARVCEILVSELKARYRVVKAVVDKEEL